MSSAGGSGAGGGYSEDDVRRAAEIREWLVKQIADKLDEVDRLRITLSIIDNLLKQGSFRAAAAFAATPPAVVAQTQMQARQVPQPPAATVAVARQQIQRAAPATQAASSTTSAAPPAATLRQDDRDVRPLKRAKDDMLLANAEVSPGAVVITPAQGIGLNAGTPPFRSFFLNRILEGMKGRDAEKASHGALAESEALSYKVDEDANGMIKRITISNYRDKERLTEIFNTSSWVFTRMLEKSG